MVCHLHGDGGGGVKAFTWELRGLGWRSCVEGTDLGPCMLGPSSAQND